MTQASQAQSLFETEPPVERNGHKLVIIDGHALVFRSYYAIRQLSNSKGQPTNAVFGFIRSLLRILQEEEEHDATIVTFDAPAKTFRHEQYEDYKAGRAPMPEDLPWQVEKIKEAVRHLGLHQLEQAGLEADDLIGTIASRCFERGYSVEIVTSDRDIYQLVNEHICVRGLTKTDRFGPAEVHKKFGVRVDQWVDYRSLTGDASDNIPGAKGIGPKTAAKLLQRYDTLDYILEHLDEVEPSSAAKKIAASRAEVEFSKQLSRIVTDADLDIDPKNWADRSMDADAMRTLLSELEFGSIMAELGLHSETRNERSDYKTIDPEDTFYGGALGYVLSSERAMYAELRELATASEGSVATLQTPEQMLELLSREAALKACDAKSLAVFARKQGIKVPPGDDPLLMAYALDTALSDAKVVTRKFGSREWGELARDRAVVTAELLGILPEKLEPQQKKLYEEIDKPLSEVLVHLEHCGIKLDCDFLNDLSESLEQQVRALEQQVRDIAGDPQLNVNSRDQLATLLFDKLELQAGRKTATGKRSTAVSALEPLREVHPVIGMILEYRELSKLKSTYLDPLPKLVHPETGRIHTTMKQAVVATGRISSINPNLQNIPVRTEIGRQIRKAFVAEDGSKLLVADYSQIELRVLAHISEEPALIESFQAEEDIHRRTAAQIHNVALDEVEPSMRRIAKIINFGVLYGMSAHRLSREISVSFSEASDFIDRYFARYPRVKAYIEETLDFTREHGYVETLFGRRRSIPDINSKNRNAREYAERTAYNMPIQGTAADIIKLAMIALMPELEALDAKLLLQVHDELIVEAPTEVVGKVAPLIKRTMEDAFQMAVPLIAEVGIGDNWLEAK